MAKIDSAAGWWVVAGSTVGLLVGPGQFVIGSLGLFTNSFTTEFGWNRTQINLGITCLTVALMFTLPYLGTLVDRYGSRKIVIPSLLILGLLIGSIPLLVSELWHLWLIFGLIGSLGVGANGLPFLRTISTWFDRYRGLAIGFTMAGSGLGFMIVPPLVQYMIDSKGWNAGYYLLAGIIIFIATPIVFFLFHDRELEAERHDQAISVNNQNNTIDPITTGVSRAEAITGSVFLRLFVIFTLLSFSLYGVLPHVVPMLTDRGMDTSVAAFAASSVGITIIVARIIVGHLIDRFFAPTIAAVSFSLSSIGFIILAAGGVDGSAFVAMLLVGFSIGAEIDLMTFLAGRYFGLRNFGQIFGVLFASLLVGVSLGPLTYGWVFDRTGAYTSILLICVGLIVLAAVITKTLPAYPDFEKTELTNA